MERLKIEAKKRDKVGKEYAKKIRAKGLVPAVIYRKGVSVLLELKEADLIHLIHEAHSENVLVDLEVIIDSQDKELRTAIVKDIEYDPIKDKVLHVDFQEISLQEVVRVKVPIEIKGEAIGVKRDSGILEHLLWEVEIECQAEQIPEKIELDVSGLEIGDAIHIKDLVLAEGLKAIGAPEQVIVHIAAPKAEVIEEMVTTAEEIQEPEVIKEKKKKEEEVEEE